MAGIPFSWRSPSFAEDACMMCTQACQWSKSSADRNRAMHALHGNIAVSLWCFASVLLLFFPYCLAFISFFTDSWINRTLLVANHFMFEFPWSPCILLFICVFMHMASFRQRRNKVKRCRFIGGRRFAVKRKRSRSPIKLICLMTLIVMWMFLKFCFTYECYNVGSGLPHANFLSVHFSHFCVPLHSPQFSPVLSWCTSRKARNRMQHAINGNMVGQDAVRCRWESSAQTPGIQLANADELKLPQEEMLVILRSDQVSDNQVGIAFCNALLLKPKLRVRSDKYLALIVPGKLGTDLQTLLKEASPTLRAKCHETTLTLKDPVLGKVFPRSVVIINLGAVFVSPATLPITVQAPSNTTKVLWVQAWQTKCQDLWKQTVAPTVRETRRNVVRMISEMTKLDPRHFDVWNFQMKDEQFSFCARFPIEENNHLWKMRLPMCGLPMFTQHMH